MSNPRFRYVRHRTALGPGLPYASVECSQLADLVRQDRVFSLSRFGDGEFLWMHGRPGFVSRSGHGTFKDGSERLRQTLLVYGTDGELRGKQPPYLLAGPTFFAGYGTEERKRRFQWYEDWIRGNGLEHLRWMSNLVFTGSVQRAAEAGEQWSLHRALMDKHVVIVGPPWLQALGNTLPYRHYVRVPVRNCWLCYDRIKRDIVRYWESTTERPIFFSLSASFSANLLIHDLADTVGRDCWLVDVGSVWDPYVGYYQRRYHYAIARAGGMT